MDKYIFTHTPPADFVTVPPDGTVCQEKKVERGARLYTRIIHDVFWRWYCGVSLHCFNVNCIKVDIHREMGSAAIFFNFEKAAKQAGAKSDK